MQHTWTIVQHDGPNHLELRLNQRRLKKLRELHLDANRIEFLCDDFCMLPVRTQRDGVQVEGGLDSGCIISLVPR